MEYIPRLLSSKLKKYLSLYSVVVIVGPRRAGKTTFIRHELPGWRYYDMEKPSDYNRISGDIEYFLQNYGEHCIIDEAQTIPELFPVLRSYIDEHKNKKGKIVLLGSVDPRLVKGISESLAGRVGFLELTPILYAELNDKIKNGFEELWLKGGYPEIIRWNEADHFNWIENYIRTFVERDVLKVLKTSLSPQKQSNLLRMIAHMHAKIWNASQISSAFGVSYHTVNEYVDLLEHYFLIRRLQPYIVNIGKRLIKRPKFYFRDTGILHYLLNINSQEAMDVSPYRGFSFEGFVIEQIIQSYQRTVSRQVEFYFYRTSLGDEIDLLVQCGSSLEGYEIKSSLSVAKEGIVKFSKCLDQLKLKKGTIIYLGKEDYSINSRITVKSAKHFLSKTLPVRSRSPLH